MPGFASRRGGSENDSFAGSFSTGWEAGVVLAMQKVEGSNPFSRFVRNPLPKRIPFLDTPPLETLVEGSPQ
jgi:hypothetical protein